MKKRDLVIEFAMGKYGLPDAITIGTIKSFRYDEQLDKHIHRCSRCIYNVNIFSYPYSSIMIWNTNISKNKLFEKLKPYMEVEDHDKVIKIISRKDIIRLR